MKIDYRWNCAELIARVIIYLFALVAMLKMICTSPFGIPVSMAIAWAMWFLRIPYFEIEEGEEDDC